VDAHIGQRDERTSPWQWRRHRQRRERDSRRGVDRLWRDERERKSNRVIACLARFDMRTGTPRIDIIGVFSAVVVIRVRVRRRRVVTMLGVSVRRLLVYVQSRQRSGHRQDGSTDEQGQHPGHEPSLCEPEHRVNFDKHFRALDTRRSGRAC
jgi:hypothetical protein